MYTTACVCVFVRTDSMYMSKEAKRRNEKVSKQVKLLIEIEEMFFSDAVNGIHLLDDRSKLPRERPEEKRGLRC